ncbi:poly(A)-specific ribonuclease PARN, putative [Plasmodium malariae]|uniref:Poly(A)-specific ribonuclease PARN, putative n=1 Tax=Plasmodium malariae TaxID=5858 RepID=A0A1C3L1S1_PLAMA|nr:poly(A)-specific ribonuclease PARN, putative [Plasmodium malariae]
MMSNVLNYFFKNFVLKEKKTFLRYNTSKRRYSKITSVNINNWNNIHKEIINKINDSDFVSIDVEYTGLHLKDERYISIDSSYEAHCYGAKSFFPCQIGITIAKKKYVIITHDNYEGGKENTMIKRNIHNIKVEGNNEEKRKKYDLEKRCQEWDISPYCIYVFPKENKYFSVSTTTLIFLRENNFDFNEWIFNGVGYLRPNEEEEKKKNIFEKIDELKNFLNKCNSNECSRKVNENEEVPRESKEKKEKNMDIKKIIQEIENYKIVDEEDKEAVVQIIKKIGIWLNSETKASIVNYSNNHIKSKVKFPTQISEENTRILLESKNGEESPIHLKKMYTQKNDIKSDSFDDANNSYFIKGLFDKGEVNIYQNNACDSLDIEGKNENGIICNRSSSNRISNRISNRSSSDSTNCGKPCDDENAGSSEKMFSGFRNANNLDDYSPNYPLYIEIENPYLRLLAHTLITKYFNSIFCISVKVNNKKHLAIYRSEKDSYKEQIRAFQLEIEKINQTIGVRLLFDEIIKNKKIITGHNCFYDILHIYQTFYHDLPTSISIFKKKWIELFPYTFDTKYMNETNEYLYALNGPATLKGLCDYMASLISSSNDFDFFFNFINGHLDLPQCYVQFVNKKNDSPRLNEEGYSMSDNVGSNDQNNEEDENRCLENDKISTYCENKIKNVTCETEEKTCSQLNNTNNNMNNVPRSDEHNAGYDSLLTCLLFIFQCHYILKKNNIMWSDIYFNRKNNSNESAKCFFDIFSSMCNKIKIVKTQPNVISLTSADNYEMARHFYMYDYPTYFKKWEIMKIWSPIWISLNKVDDHSCWIIAKSDEDAKNIKMIYKMLQNPQFKLCTYEEYLNKFKSK